MGLQLRPTPSWTDQFTNPTAYEAGIRNALAGNTNPMVQQTLRQNPAPAPVQQQMQYQNSPAAVAQFAQPAPGALPPPPPPNWKPTAVDQVGNFIGGALALPSLQRVSNAATDVINEWNGNNQKVRDQNTENNKNTVGWIKYYGNVIRNGTPDQQQEARQRLKTLMDGSAQQDKDFQAVQDKLVDDTDLAKNIGAAGNIALTYGTLGVGGAAAKTVADAGKVVVPTLAKQIAGGGALNTGASAFGVLEDKGTQATTSDYINAAGPALVTGAAIPVAGATLAKLARVGMKGAPETAPAAVNPDVVAGAVMSPVETKALTKLDKKATTTALNSDEQTQRQQLQAKQGATAPPASEPQVTQPGRISSDKTGYDAVDTAIKDMHDHYNNTPQFSEGSLWDIVQASQGKAAAGRRLAANLNKSLEKHFTNDERHAIYDELQGVDNEHATDATHRTAEALRALQENAHSVRLASKPDVGKVVDYAPRIIRQTIKNAASGAGRGVRARLKSVMDIGSLESNFNQSRQVNKFVDGSGNAVYGSKGQLGLTQKGGQNHFEDANGNVYQQTTSTTHELKEHTGTDYLNDVAPVQGIYHADTANLKVKQAALNELNKNPNQHGLFTKEQVDANGWHDSMKEVNVTGLKDANGENLYATVKDATQLERSSLFGRPDRRSIAGKAYDAASNFATKLIVLNPVFHGANQLVQTAIAAGNMKGLGPGWYKVMKGMSSITEDDIHEYLDNGGHLPSYGSEAQNALGRATRGVSQVPSKAMADIEKQLRVGLYKASVDSGMAPEEAIANIDKFLGDQKQLSRGTQRVVLFGHYLKTMGGAIGNQVRHPRDNLGANINTVAVAAILAGMTYEYQQFTGNKDAYARMPGEIGLIKNGIDAVGQIASGELPSVLTNHINPVAKEIGQQLANIDLFTGKAIDQGGGALDRLGHVGGSLVAPSQQASQVISGKRSLPEIAENQLGLYSPHAKGYVATTNPAVSFLNTDGAITGKNGDPTGKIAQTAYFDNLKVAQDATKGDKKLTDALNSFLDHNHDPATGASIQNSPREAINNSGNLATNDTFRGIVQQFEKSQPSHDPVWDLPDDKLKALMQYRSQFTGDAAKTVLHDAATNSDGSNWIDTLQKQSSDYYNNIQRPKDSKTPIANGPEYPKFDQPTQDLIDNYFKADAATKRTMMQQNSGELSTAFNKIAQYTNAMRKAEGAPEKNDYPVADAETQKIMDTYNALPQHDGKRGGNAARYAWGQAHPDEYAKMQAYMTQATLHSLIDEASQAQFKGTEPSQKLLGDIKNMGTYDISTTKLADGTNQYALATNQNGGSSGSVSKSYGNSYSSSKGSSGGKKGTIKSSGFAKGSQKVQFGVPHTAYKAPKVKVAHHAASNKRLKTGVAGVSNKNKPKVSLKPVGA